jgi:hypothetical protein
MSGLEIPGGRYEGAADFYQADGTPMVLAAVARHPKISVGCIFNQPNGVPFEYALSICYMPEGCVALNARTQALPHFAVQALCQHHDGRQTPLGDSLLLADLSREGTWSERIGAEPILPVGFDEEHLAVFSTTALGRAIYGPTAQE